MKKTKFNWTAILSISIITAVCLPILYYFNFSLMGGDDFLYGKDTFHIYADTGSYFNAVKIAFTGTIDTYLHWQGSFFSVFLMYLQPGIISLDLYRITLLVIFLLSIVSPCIAAFTFNRYYLNAPKKYIWIILASYIFVITQYMPSMFQAFYWYNSAIYYQFTLAAAFLFTVAFIRYRHTKSKVVRRLLFSALILMDIMIAGSNFPLGLVICATFTLYITVAYIKKYEFRNSDTIIYVVFTAIFLANVLAPGNIGRQASSSVSPGLFTAAYASVRDMAIETPAWIKSTITLAVICAMLPASRKITENSKIKFAHPAMAGIIILFLLLAQYFPVEYGLGSKGPGRVENLRFILLNLGIWLFFINLFGYMKDRDKPANRILAVVICIALLAVSLSDKGINSFTSYKMADQITNGELKEFARIANSELVQFEDTDSHEPIYYKEHITNEFLHPDITFWFHSGIWDYYRNSPEK